MKTTTTRQSALFGSLAAVSAFAQLFHLGYRTQWGMWIDIVGVPWIMAYLLFGIRGGLLVSGAASIIIALIDNSGWLGALAKFLATIPMVIVPYMVFHIKKTSPQKNPSVGLFSMAVILAVLVRGILMFFFNYYFALPIWIPGQSPEQLMAMVPPYIIVGINALQGILETTVAWIIVFHTKLRKFIPNHVNQS